MVKSATVRLALWLAAVAIAAVACRQQQPSGDPKMPANSPIPTIDRKEDGDSSKTPAVPSPLASDGGASR
ncbi:MAG: hypothetical protein JST00_00220 [Deltaproteobacteria bacterium]|nr:hypothetical protein [Deltaproteobacteria bacterium]